MTKVRNDPPKKRAKAPRSKRPREPTRTYHGVVDQTRNYNDHYTTSQAPPMPQIYDYVAQMYNYNYTSPPNPRASGDSSGPNNDDDGRTRLQMLHQPAMQMLLQQQAMKYPVSIYQQPYPVSNYQQPYPVWNYQQPYPLHLSRSSLQQAPLLSRSSLQQQKQQQQAMQMTKSPVRNDPTKKGARTSLVDQMDDNNYVLPSKKE